MSETYSKAEARIISIGWQHFGAGVICTSLFPLFPLFLEKVIAGSISDGSILISAVMYCSALALSSESVLTFILGFLASIAFAVLFGISVYNDDISLAWSHSTSYLAFAFFGLNQMLQSYNRHVVRGDDFFSFASNRG